MLCISEIKVAIFLFLVFWILLTLNNAQLSSFFALAILLALWKRVLLSQADGIVEGRQGKANLVDYFALSIHFQINALFLLTMLLLQLHVNVVIGGYDSE